MAAGYTPPEKTERPAPGWDYHGNYSYGGFEYDEYGNSKLPAHIGWKEHVERWKKNTGAVYDRSEHALDDDRDFYKMPTGQTGVVSNVHHTIEVR